MQYFDQIIFRMSSGLMVPVMLAVLYLLVRALVLLGGCYGQYRQRSTVHPLLNEKLNVLTYKDTRYLNQLLPTLPGRLPFALSELIAATSSEPHRIRMLADYANSCEKDLDKYRTLSKTGPILGLMGTLIPMGPALGGLAAGDVATMSQQMQLAFNTTVMGLVIGTIGFLLLQTKQRWYIADLTKMEFLNDIIQQQHETVQAEI
ncbi:MotA/TolQ/ExbB proton channel family protein [Chitinophaga sp. Cy-1792]|uniref:MotA/TolQ/ExbB proton channel family protein n=1 Tax=Chitinophaga sp. Cy-1792 TaxID=2608339 RepID=UPI0014224329|nr:MotA/TolQ/ExbB proton channel family protein [Chitinophaga sp. Cy-1792]NIG56475.1 MotA/TolQ/ExbB proton channel family protein [Chitinophaga sp. Cy-1792]